MTYSAEVLADSPLAYYRLGDLSGTTAEDSSGNNRDAGYFGTPSLGATGLLTGDPDTAVAFSGDDYVALSYAAWMDVANLTVEAWVKTTATGVRIILSRDSSGARGWQFRLNGGNLEFVKILGGTVTVSQTAALNDGAAHHVAATYDGTSLRLYIDGVLVKTQAMATLSGSTGYFTIGRDSVSPGSYFDGTIDEAAFYGTALSAERINAHYREGIQFFTEYEDVVLADAPLAYWRLDEASGAVMVDSSGNGRNGGYTGSPGYGATGLLVGDANTAISFAANSANYGGHTDAAWMDVGVITLEAWVKPTSFAATRAILGRDLGGSIGTDRSFQFRIETSGKVGVILFLNGSGTTFSFLTSTTTLTVNETYHLVATFDGSNIRLYINGVLDSTLAASGTLNSGTTSIFVGRVQSATPIPFSGTIDEVAIYGAVLAPQRIAEHYLAGIARVLEAYPDEVLADSPLAYYRLGEPSGTTMVDSSGNGRDGTYAGATLNHPGLLTGDPNTAAHFDGNAGASVPGAAWMNTGSAFSVECWLSSTDSATHFLGRGTGGSRTGWALWLHSDGKIFFSYTSGGATVNGFDFATASGGYNDGGTHHVVGTYDGTTARIYVDGALSGSKPVAGPMPTVTGQPIRVGGLVSFMAGVVDEVAYYGTALSADRVRAHYLSGVYGAGVSDIELGVAEETDTAVGLIFPLGLAADTSTVPGGLSSSTPIHTVIETNSALPISTSLGTVIETDLALPLLTAFLLGRADETDSALPVSSSGVFGLATEADTVPGGLGYDITITGLDFVGSGVFAVDAAPADFLRIDFSGSSSFVPLLQPESAPDPTTGQSVYRVLIVDMYGKPYGELQNAVLGNPKWSINDKGSFSFTVPADDPKVQEVQVPEREVQVWRGGRLLWWGVIVRAREGGSMVEFQCQTLEWYFDRRLVGLIPRKGVFKGTHLEYGTGQWVKKWIPGTEPKHTPVASVVNDRSIAGGNSMMLSAAGGMERKTRPTDDWFTGDTANLTTMGENAIENFVDETFGDDPVINVSVFHDNTLGWKEARALTQDRADAIEDYVLTLKPGARVYAKGKGRKNPVETNRTSAGRAANRRIVFAFRDTELVTRGHGQYVTQSYEVRIPRRVPHRVRATFRAWVYVDEFMGPAANNWGLVLERQHKTRPFPDPKLGDKGYKKVFSRAFIPINKETPKNRWVRMEASVMVPNDGRTYVLEGRIFPPYGTIFVDEADLFLDDALDYVEEEQADIFKDLVDHAQDPEFGKSDLNIRRRVPETGVKRTRRYPFSERSVIGDHLNEFTTLGDGMEWDIAITPDKRILKTYFPRKERKTGYVLRLGQNVSSADVDVDGVTTSNVVVVMANDVEAYAREERAAIDLSLLDGTVMEIAYMATPGTTVGSLNAQARRGLERYRKPVTIPSVTTNPAYVNELLQKTQTGDVVLVDVREGWFRTLAEYRILDMTLNTSTEQITYTLMPEDAPIKVLAGWEDLWLYKTQAQSTSTGSNNGAPKPTHPEYAERDYDDSGWTLGRAGFGWFQDGSVNSSDVDIEPNTTIPNNHEVWMRKAVKCTEEMYVSVRCDKFAFVYVNGHLVRDRHFIGENFANKFLSPAIRVPQDFLDPSGVQVVTLHVQDRLKDPSTDPRALFADLKVRGIYDPNHVSL